MEPIRSTDRRSSRTVRGWAGRAHEASWFRCGSRRDGSRAGRGGARLGGRRGSTPDAGCDRDDDHLDRDAGNDRAGAGHDDRPADDDDDDGSPDRPTDRGRGDAGDRGDAFDRPAAQPVGHHHRQRLHAKRLDRHGPVRPGGRRTRELRPQQRGVRDGRRRRSLEHLVRGAPRDPHLLRDHRLHHRVRRVRHRGGQPGRLHRVEWRRAGVRPGRAPPASAGSGRQSIDRSDRRSAVVRLGQRIRAQQFAQRRPVHRRLDRFRRLRLLGWQLCPA